jgi:L-ascorbate metabolism protein UlaG (beta-lactamase superfamily)
MQFTTKINGLAYFFFCIIGITLASSSGCAQSAKLSEEKTIAPYDGKKFDNIEPFEEKSFFTLLKWQFSRWRDKTDRPWPDFRNIPVHDVMQIRSQELKVVVINHATVLIQIDGLNILTDPHFSERASPVSWAGPKRAINPGVKFESLPPIDLILISHNHYDHMDIETLLKLQSGADIPILVGLKSRNYLEKAGLKNIIELDWWQDYSVTAASAKSSFKITFVPAQHWSARSLWDKREMLWGGFYLTGSKKIYFAGDTGYGIFFKLIREKLSPPDLAFLPIGAYEPRWFMKPAHVNPEEAVQGMLDLQATRAIGVHFGTFKLTDEGIDDPKQALEAALDKLKVERSRFIVPEFGKSY